MSLAQKAAQGAVWTIVAGIGSRTIGLVGTLVMTRFLAPDVMGEVVTATIVAFMANWATQIGIGQYVLVRREEEGSEPVFHAAVLSLVIGFVALGAIALLAPQIAALFDAPNLAVYLPGMALAVFIRRVSTVPDKLLLRRLRFRTVAAATAVGEVAYAGVAVTLVALTDLGGTAVVIGNIVQACVVSGIVIGACGVSSWLAPTRLRLQKIKEILAFGLPLGVEGFLSETARYGDKLVYTRMFGLARTGEYSLAHSLADLPATYVGEQVANIFLPTLLRVDAHKRMDVLVRAVGMLALATFPMAAGLAVVSPTLVAALLPDQWQGVAPFLTVLAAVSVFRPISGLLYQFLLSAERSQALMWVEALRVVVLLGGVFALGALGPVVAAGAVGIAACIHMLALIRAIRGDGRFVVSLLGRLGPPVVACAIMVAVVLGIRASFGPVAGMFEVLRLVTEIVGGACAYAAAILIFGRAASREALTLARGALRLKRA